jgi:oligopeptide transport system ATP-binding protein
MRDETGAAIILITHDVGVVAELCDQVIVMYAGRAVESGPTRQVFTSPTHPYTIGLLCSTLELARDRKLPLTAIPGLPPELIHLPPGCAFAPRCSRADNVCSQSRPALAAVAPGHQVACWHWQEG